MEITFNLTDQELTVDDITLIKDCLGLESETELDISLKKLSKAAFMEYINMLKEKGLPTRASEVQQERLFFLLIHYFQNRLPSENELSSILQLTQSQSKTLLRNTKSRYRTKISRNIRATLLEIINSATREDEKDPYEFVCCSQTMFEELNLIIIQKGPTLEPIQKIKGIASKYCCASDTYNLLKKELS